MIETTVSNDLVYLCMLHYEYLTIMDNSEVYKYKPISIIKDRETKLFTLTVELNSNQQINNNEQNSTERNSEFSKRTPRIS